MNDKKIIKKQDNNFVDIKKMKTFKVLSQADKTIILTPQKPLYSLIWLHGLGDSSAGFFDYFQHQFSPLNHGFRIKLLHAPIKPVTINMGMEMPSWYDIKQLNFQSDRDKNCSLDEVNESLKIIDKKVQQQIQFYKKLNIQNNIYKNIFIGGFSQGCAMSLLYGLTSKNIIGGVIGLSGYLFQSFDLPNVGKLPILLFHGSKDQLIPIAMAKKSYEKIIKNNEITYFQKKLAHQVNQAQLIQINSWLLDKISKNS